jgi:hypothetical protein
LHQYAQALTELASEMVTWTPELWVLKW